MTITELIELLSSAKAGSIAAMLAATISAIAGIRAMVRNSDAAQLQRKQDAAMKVIAARALICFEQFQIAAFAQTNGNKLDPYFAPSAKLNVKRLEESLDEALGIGLIDHIVGTGKHALMYHTAFAQSLAHIANKHTDELNDPVEWTKQHYMFGLVRLLVRCLNYPRRAIAGELRDGASRSIKGLRDEAFSYIEAKQHNG